MLKINSTVRTNINHISQNRQVNEIKTQEKVQDRLFYSNSKALGVLLGTHQDRIGFFQLLKENFQKLSSKLEGLEECKDEMEFGSTVGEMMDLVDNTLYGGKSLFAQAINFGFDMPNFEDIESAEDIESFLTHVKNLSNKLNENLMQESIATANILSALSVSEDHLNKDSKNLESMKELIRDV
ncbi:MAG: hypothetical protein M0P02_07105 [Sulfurospirillaceae bacterium]|jgi:membrane-associated HD superfamily phosphohydrolase|nr:hypothetical protein [Sulfurospirillaceae bacterium]MCK9545691.1 hypothetical protein [Sulfurospirillaceae bacterium]NLM99570.1 hypothetical protein [Campylobacteraceae bacterium]